MNTTEFSNAFDVLLDSYRSVIPFGKENNIDTIELDEYEKSIYLTLAQESIVVDLYNGRVSNNKSFEETEELRRYLSNLVLTYTTSEKETEDIEDKGLSTASVFFKIPENVLFITNESVKIDDDTAGFLDNTYVKVQPVTQDEYHSLIRNPFRRPSRHKAIRLDVHNNIVEIIPPYNIGSYRLRYLSKPTPIVLEDLGGVSVSGVSTKTECTLHPILHKDILDRAVAMVYNSRYVRKEDNKENK